MSEQNEAAKKALEKEREASNQSRKDAQERLSQGKPTPTQEENDLAKLGHHFTEHEDDGSGPEPHLAQRTRSMEAKPGSSGGYQTRAGTAAGPTSRHPGTQQHSS